MKITYIGMGDPDPITLFLISRVNNTTVIKPLKCKLLYSINELH